MCQKVTCPECSKATWAGCGQHVAQVKRSVPASQWCNGRHSQREIDEANAGKGFLARVFGR